MCSVECGNQVILTMLKSSDLDNVDIPNATSWLILRSDRKPQTSVNCKITL